MEILFCPGPTLGVFYAPDFFFIKKNKSRHLGAHLNSLLPLSLLTCFTGFHVRFMAVLCHLLHGYSCHFKFCELRSEGINKNASKINIAWNNGTYYLNYYYYPDTAILSQHFYHTERETQVPQSMIQMTYSLYCMLPRGWGVKQLRSLITGLVHITCFLSIWWLSVECGNWKHF